MKLFLGTLCFFSMTVVLAVDSKNPYLLDEVNPYYMLSFYNNAYAMEDLIAKVGRPKVVIEVGSYLGASTKHLASLVEEGGKVYAVDWWRGLNYAQEKPVPGSHQEGWGQVLPKDVDMYTQFLSNMIHLGLANIVVPIRADTSSGEGILKNLGVFSADIVYIDADHSYTGTLADCRTWYPFVSEGKGVLCGDDWGWSARHLGDNYILGVQRAVTQFAIEENLSIHTNGVFWFLTEK